ncbi:MAG: DUF2971 domain-containing protein [Pyrinomonadaceae bacterium]
MPVHRPSETDAAFESLMRRMPAKLYKYSGVSGRRLEWIRRLLVDSELYFTSPSTFNDPLDCRISLHYDASALKVEQYWRHFVKQQFPGTPVRAHKERIKELVTDSRTLQGRERLNEWFLQQLDKNGIVCLGNSPNNVLMWSYYAEGHKGIAIQFNMAPENLVAIKEQNITVEVKYSRDFPRINFYESSLSDAVPGVFGTKAEAWKHEGEWRIVLIDQVGYVRIPPAMIDAVILGLRIDKDSEDQIKQCIQQRATSTKLLRVQNVNDSFELKIVTV